MAPPSNQNPLNFHWPETTHSGENTDDYYPETTETTADKVVNTVKNIINTFVNNQTEETIIPTTAAVDETFNSNATIVGQGQNSFDEMFNSNSTIMEVNSTIITEMTESSATTIATITDNSNATSFIGTVIDSVATTTETIFNTVSETISSTKSAITTTEETVDMTSGHHEEDFEDKTLYIVLGIIIAALFFILIILLIVYRRYKKINYSTSRAYCVHTTNSNDVR